MHKERPHLAKDNEPLVPATPDSSPKKRKGRKQAEQAADVVPPGAIHCRQWLGGC